jgi:non-heme chloroperoxidase
MLSQPISTFGVRFATLAQANGPTLRYAISGPEAGQPIVLLHGYSDSSFSFSRVMPLLARQGFQAIALDQRGHGDSDRPERGYRIEDFAGDVVALLDKLEIDRATVVGHSMGSIVARRVAELHPDRVAGLVLIGAVETPMREGVQELQAAVESLEDPVPEEFVREFQASTIHEPVPETFFEQVVTESMKLPARVWRAVLEGLLAADDADELGKISAPTILLWGEHDAYFLRDQQDRLAAAIPSARLQVYADTGHSPQWERPDVVARDIQAFVSSLRPASSR